MSDNTAQIARIDAAMLESLSIWFVMRDRGFSAPHPFNDADVSEMLARVAKTIAPRPRAALYEGDE